MAKKKQSYAEKAKAMVQSLKQTGSTMKTDALKKTSESAKTRQIIQKDKETRSAQAEGRRQQTIASAKKTTDALRKQKQAKQAEAKRQQTIKSAKKNAKAIAESKARASLPSVRQAAETAKSTVGSVLKAHEERKAAVQPTKTIRETLKTIGGTGKAAREAASGKGFAGKTAKTIDTATRTIQAAGQDKKKKDLQTMAKRIEGDFERVGKTLGTVQKNEKERRKVQKKQREAEEKRQKREEESRKWQEARKIGQLKAKWADEIKAGTVFRTGAENIGKIAKEAAGTIETARGEETKRQEDIASGAITPETVLQDMARRSNRWAILENAKNTTAQNETGKKQIRHLEIQQEELHRQNALDAAQFGLAFDQDSGQWKLGQDYEKAGQAVYDTALHPSSPETVRTHFKNRIQQVPGDVVRQASDPGLLENFQQAHGGELPKTPIMLPKTPQEIAQMREAARNRAALPSYALAHNTAAGLAGIANAAYSTLDFFLPDPITPKFVQDYIDKAKQTNSDIKEQVTAWDYEHGGAVGGFVGSTYQSFVEMLPQAVAALMTGGISTAGTGLQYAGGISNTAFRALDNAAKNPAYWLSFLQVAGPEYERKKKEGMDDLSAATSALISALGQAGIEMGGGLETMTESGKTGLKLVGKTALEEGGEEVAQDIFSGLTDKGFYDGVRPVLGKEGETVGKSVFGMGDANALINPQRMASEFAAGALLGGIAGGTKILPAAHQMNVQQKLNPDIRIELRPWDTVTYKGMPGTVLRTNEDGSAVIRVQDVKTGKYKNIETSPHVAREILLDKLITDARQNGALLPVPDTQNPSTAEGGSSSFSGEAGSALLPVPQNVNVTDSQTLRRDGQNASLLPMPQNMNAADSARQIVQHSGSQQGKPPNDITTLNDHIRRNKELFAKQGIIAEIQGDEISGRSGTKLVERVHDFFKSIGGKVTRPGFGDVTLTKSGIRDSIYHGVGDKKAAAFAAVPDVIQQGQIIDEQHDWKDRRFNTVVFGGRVTIGGVLYDMGVIVKKYDDAQTPSKYYLHEVLLVNEEGKATPYHTGTRPNDSVGYPSDVTLPSDASITQEDLDVNSLDTEKGKAQTAETPGFQQTRQDGAMPQPMPQNVNVQESQTPRQENPNVARMTDEEYRAARKRLDEIEETLTGKDRRAIAEQENWRESEWVTEPDNPEMVQEYRELQEKVKNELETARNENALPQITEEEYTQAKKRLDEIRKILTENDKQAIFGRADPNANGQQALPDHPELVREYAKLLNDVANYQVQAHENTRARQRQTAEGMKAEHQTSRQDSPNAQQSPRLPVTIGDTVRTLDRGNVGTIISDEGGDAYEVRFYNRETGANTTRTMYSDEFEVIRQPPAPDAESREMAQNQMDALESDSYEQPERQKIQRIVDDARRHGENVARHYPLTRSDVRPEPSGAERYMDGKHTEAAVQAATSEEVHALRLTLRELRTKLKLTPSDVRMAMEFAAGRDVNIPADENTRLRIFAYTDALKEYNWIMRPVYDYWQQTQQARWKAADEFAQHSAEWTDTKTGMALDARTPERVLRKVCGKQAESMIQDYIEPVHRHEAQKIKWMNERMKQLSKVIKGVSYETGVYIHMKNRADWMQKRGFDASEICTQMAEYAREHKSKIDFDRVDAIEQGCIEMTRAIYPEISEAYIANGYDALEFLENYIPSNGVIHEGGAAAKFLRGVMGIETMADELPTEITGTTVDRRPGRTYFAAANQRTGYSTEFDLFKAMQNYIAQSADVIFHTGDIQNLRALEERIRYQYSDEATRAELDFADFEYNWDVDKRIQAKSSIWEATFGNLPNFPTWIREYTNLLAGKKLIGDRTTEHDISRGFFRTINDVEAVAARSLLGGNFSVAMSNFIALGQGSAELRARSMARAMFDYGYDLLKGDTAFRDDSAFLTRRGGVDAAYKGTRQRVNDALFWGMEAVDDISSNVLTRARYYDNIARKMDKTAAMREADAWTASLMGDRSKGSAPLLFQSKSFLRKLVTMFQLEPTNTLGHVFEDMPYEARQKGAVWLGKTLTKLAIMSFLMNDLWEKVTGRRPVQDPVGIINEFVGKITGWCMPNTFDLLGWAVSGEWDKEELINLFRTQKQDTGDAVIQTMEDASGYIPIVGGLMSSAVGSKTSRFPMESLLPDVTELVGTMNHDGTPESKRATWIEEMSKPVIGLLPAGSQTRKTYKGAKMLLEGGKYGFDQQGQTVLQFPAYGEKPGAAEKAFTASQALLFGPIATGRGQQYVRSGFMGLTADKTQIYERLVKNGMDGGKAFDTLLKMSGKMAENYEHLVIKGEIDEDAAKKAVWAVEKAEAKKGSGLTDKQAKREAIMALELDWAEKSIVDKWLIGGKDFISYHDRDMFEITNTVKQSRRQDALKLVQNYGLDTQRAKKYAELYDANGGKEAYNPITDAWETPDKDRKLKKTLDQINSADDLDEKQKESVKTVLLLPALGQKYTSDKAKKFIGDVTVDQLVDAEYTYQTIADEVKNDRSIHEKNRSEFISLRFAQYLESTGMTRAQQDGILYFRTKNMDEINKPWSEVIRLGSDAVQAAAPGLEMTGMDVDQYKIIKAGMDRIYADKDSTGKAIDGSKKKKIIAYLNQWDLTDVQKDLLMRADDYKYGMGEKPKSGKGKGKGGRKSGGGSKGSSAASGMMSGFQTLK